MLDKDGKLEAGRSARKGNQFWLAGYKVRLALGMIIIGNTPRCGDEDDNNEINLACSHKGMGLLCQQANVQE